MESKDGRKQLVFIINPISGTRRKKRLETLIERHLDHSKYHYTIEYTRYAGHGTLLARSAVATGADIVVAVGGDGSVNEVAKMLLNTKASLAIIPSGSGNGLARFLQLPIPPEKAIAVINRGKEKLIDTASVNGVFFVSLAGLGFDARVARRFGRSGKRGFLSYLSIIIKEFAAYKPRKYKIFLDGRKLRYRAFMITFANSGQFGYNTTIAPDASMTDGLLDVCIAGKPSYLQIPWLTYLLFSGRIQQSEQMICLRAKEVRVARKKNAFINIDGEAVKMDKDIVIKVKPLSLRLVIP